MATIIPELSESQLDALPSKGEAKVYRSFRDKLPKGYTVFFSKKWILKKDNDPAGDGENDFVIGHPDKGFICIEVKGGGISFDAQSDQWYSTDRFRKKHRIHDPVEQALKAKYAISEKLQEHSRLSGRSPKKVLRGHAVFFPDIGDAKQLIKPDLPLELIGTQAVLNQPEDWVSKAFSYWGQDSSKVGPIGQQGIEFFKQVFARSFDVSQLVGTELVELEDQRIRLTQEQTRVLDMLQSHRRVAVRGGAGTGKTLLALEKARRLASEGCKTLLTCYNRQLADHLAVLCKSIPNLEVMGFHQLCHSWVERASKLSGRDLLKEARATAPGAGLFDVQLPLALSYSLDEITDRFEAIVCDEGQDFGEEYWLPLELLLTDMTESPFYIFYDDNQNIYSRAGSFPIQELPITLTKNCRNTTSIHKAAYKHYRGAQVEPPELEGADLQFEIAPSQAAQARKIHSRIVDLIDRQKVPPEDITVLIGDAQRKSECYSCLLDLPLPKPASWLVEGHLATDRVLLETVPRFKGLESSVVILWGLDTADLSSNRELLYVGMSRAKSLLIISASAATVDML
ncbi:MAG: NERD domain-containing protein [Marinobacter sp.]|uniref:nuclease-related domain-containing DEAD/DEAH box helicase n=1 Tax=Marinobacter sp. TaxID=50741 RepID=UPI0032995003